MRRALQGRPTHNRPTAAGPRHPTQPAHNGADDERPPQSRHARSLCSLSSLSSRLSGCLLSKSWGRHQQAAERQGGIGGRLGRRPLLLLLLRPLLRQAPACGRGGCAAVQAGVRWLCAGRRGALECGGALSQHASQRLISVDSIGTAAACPCCGGTTESMPGHVSCIAAGADCRHAAGRRWNAGGSGPMAQARAHLTAARLELHPMRTALRAGSCTVRRAEVACMVCDLVGPMAVLDQAAKRC